ncbi:hypothetical protein ITP53_26010 [Nonomuraea sp. K274]|uniref:Uncharacterized protein n=1 Tax=Nonomuraea cypriaca TaxID=1187855 RepID=A0A931EYT7_9ACTN|nr:hypothetical protein [Nonomuraea cypriaca]MBF8189124.1 hypothetical protein [Nonomuraea cypriaca]
MAKDSLTIKVRITGVRETLKAFKDLPEDASTELREGTLALSQLLAKKVEAAGRSDSPQSALVAGTVRARKDRVPVIVAGGPKKVGSRRTPARKILFGSEFGATTLKQFRPHVGNGSYWFFQTVEAHQHEIDSAWNKVAGDIARKFGGDG